MEKMTVKLSKVLMVKAFHHQIIKKINTVEEKKTKVCVKLFVPFFTFLGKLFF